MIFRVRQIKVCCVIVSLWNIETTTSSSCNGRHLHKAVRDTSPCTPVLCLAWVTLVFLVKGFFPFFLFWRQSEPMDKGQEGCYTRSCLALNTCEGPCSHPTRNTREQVAICNLHSSEVRGMWGSGVIASGFARPQICTAATTFIWPHTSLLPTH